jgi:hypothetical protein
MQLVTNYISAYSNKHNIFSWVYLDDLIAICDKKHHLESILNIVLSKLEKSQILINKEKSSLIPSKQIEFLEANWTQNKITRLAKVDRQLDTIIQFIVHNKNSYSLKKAQQIAGYLNYYLAMKLLLSWKINIQISDFLSTQLSSFPSIQTMVAISHSKDFKNQRHVLQYV